MQGRLSLFVAVVMALGFRTEVSAQVSLGERMAATPSRIIQQQAYGRGFNNCAPVVPGCSPNTGGYGGCYRPGYNTVVLPAFGGLSYYGGFGGYAGYNNFGYGNFGGGYYQGVLEQENADLRRRLRNLEEERAEAPPAGPVNIKVPPRNPVRERNLRDRAESSIRSGMRLFQKGAYAGAADRFTQAALIVPDDAAALVYLAQAQFAAGQYRQAVAAAKEAIRRNPDWPQVEFDVRSLYPDPVDLVGQMGELARHLKTNPLDADAMFLLGFELFITDQSDKAKSIFEQAARLSPDDTHLKPFFDYFNPPVVNVKGDAKDAPAVPEPDFDG